MWLTCISVDKKLIHTIRGKGYVLREAEGK